MKVKIKDFGLEPEIKNNGLEIDVSDTKNKGALTCEVQPKRFVGDEPTGSTIM